MEERIIQKNILIVLTSNDQRFLGTGGQAAALRAGRMNPRGFSGTVSERGDHGDPCCRRR
jgi:hypothetical protein